MGLLRWKASNRVNREQIPRSASLARNDKGAWSTFGLTVPPVLAEQSGESSLA